MSKLNIKVDADRITLDDLVELENPSRSVRFIRDFLARFVADDNGEYLPEDAAIKSVGKLSIAETRAAYETLGTLLREVQENAVPLARE